VGQRPDKRTFLGPNENRNIRSESFMHIGSATLGTSCRRIAMDRVLTMITMICAMFTGASALAIDSFRSPTVAKHQMIVQMASCMKNLMFASKTIWYNEAEKACKNQIDQQRGNSTAGALVASDAPAKR
jgi:hypothetical protein